MMTVKRWYREAVDLFSVSRTELAANSSYSETAAYRYILFKSTTSFVSRITLMFNKASISSYT